MYFNLCIIYIAAGGSCVVIGCTWTVVDGGIASVNAAAVDDLYGADGGSAVTTITGNSRRCVCFWDYGNINDGCGVLTAFYTVSYCA